ncbi:universal stress protein [Peterkaempfera griseoplana]|uniref:universal stress protein n=1 Tax=Peterkaempfera griseoplana TaxID=66896 RepID=UPI0006E43E8C|nr:universal stress protein [Peterkaempfera griseoplana]
MPLPVIVGVDGSASAERALDWAAAEAASRGAPLRIVHASLWDRYEPDASDNPDLAQARRAVADLVRTAEDRVANRWPGLAAQADVVPNAPVPALLEAASSASLVVVGHRGHGGFAGLLLGSVALQTAARASCPVVVVRGDDDAVERRHGRIVLGVGRTDAAGPTTAFAFEYAERWGARLEAVHAWHAPPDPFLAYGPGQSAMADACYVQAGSLLKSATAHEAAAHPQVSLQLVPRWGPRHSVLVESAAAADLLVVGARRHPGPGMHLGPVNHAALHHAPCPVVIVPHR